MSTDEKYSYGMMQLLTAVDVLKDRRSIGKKDRAWARAMLPYLLHGLGNGDYLPLNREYNPLGFNNKGFVAYEDFQLLTITSQDVDLTQIFTANLYLFDDATAPWVSSKMFDKYVIRLHALLGLDRPTRSYMGGQKYI